MRVLLIITLTMFLFSCGKKRTIVITATNAATGQRIAGLPYNVFSSYTGGNGQKYKTVASGVLNSQGEATIQLRQIPNKSYCVKVDEPSNTCYNKVITMYFDSPNDEDGHFNFKFAECAYLKQNIYNINCSGVNDYMILFTKNKVNSLGTTGWEFFGCNGYVGDHFSSVPIGDYYFKWEVTRNGITNTYYDTIYLSPGEYKTYTINY